MVVLALLMGVLLVHAAALARPRPQPPVRPANRRVYIVGVVIRTGQLARVLDAKAQLETLRPVVKASGAA